MKTDTSNNSGPLPKIFGIGLSKTGTTSLSSALNALGIKTVHFPCDDRTYTQVTGGDLRLSILKTCQGIADITVAPYYPQLSALYPGSKFILTVREKSTWLESMEAHWRLMLEWCRRDAPFQRFTNFMTAAVYGVLHFNAERFSYVYDLHYRNATD